MSIIQNFLLGVRRQEKWYHRFLYQLALKIRNIRMPFSRFFGAFYFHERNARITVWRRFKQFFYYEPMFRYRCKHVGKGVYFESNFPLILGYGSVSVGDSVKISGNATFIVSYKVNDNPEIIIGNNVYIGYATVFSSAEKITIGNRVLIAMGAQFYDNNNHPLDPQARLENKPVEKENIAPVIIEDDVWIGANAVILKGVTVGRGSVVALNSVVSKDVHPMSIVAGNPAKVVRKIESISDEFKIADNGEIITETDSKIMGSDN
ncbi:MAG: DapH/DapD/GlmU-related protein [Candidatus Zixiibacteriota bacterium]